MTLRATIEPSVPCTSSPVPACFTVKASCSWASTPLSKRSTAITPSSSSPEASSACCDSATASTGLGVEQEAQGVGVVTA